MISNISITFGTKDFLSNIIKQHPEHNLHLFASENNDSYELVDSSGKSTIFKSPINYKLVSHAGVDNWNGAISYINLDLDENQQKVLDATINNLISNEILPNGMSSIYSLYVAKNKSSRVILTTWNNGKSLDEWYLSKTADQLFKFSDKLDSNYFETIYHAVK
ncbi:hypothetical protein ACYATM_03695 [Lactobacillaceae bacterium Scapto_B20]